MHWFKSYASLFVHLVYFSPQSSWMAIRFIYNFQLRFIKYFFLIWYISFLQTITSIGIRIPIELGCVCARLMATAC